MLNIITHHHLEMNGKPSLIRCSKVTESDFTVMSTTLYAEEVRIEAIPKQNLLHQKNFRAITMVIPTDNKATTPLSESIPSWTQRFQTTTLSIHFFFLIVATGCTGKCHDFD
jgi:hypothetical protein